jgi:hypothetical protein
MSIILRIRSKSARLALLASFAISLGLMASPVHASTLTPSQVSAIIGLLQSFNADPSVIANVQSNLSGKVQSPSFCLTLTASLSQGSTDTTTQGQVSKLQQFLGITPTTGYFGVLTEAAVQKYQTARGIVSSGTPATTGYGSVGARTRASMASCGVETTGPASSNTSPSTTASSGATSTVPRVTPIVSPPSSGGGGGGGGGGGMPVPVPTPPIPAPTTYNVTGFVWLDTNGDHAYTNGEMKMPGRTVTLSQSGTVVQTTTTDASGTYTFNVPAGIYRVDHNYLHFNSTGAVCNGVYCSGDNSTPVTLSKSTEVDFGISLPSPCGVTLRDFGAVGDSKADDTLAIGRALTSKCLVLGENLTYRVTKTIELPDNTYLSSATFLQDIPATGLLRLFLKQSGNNVTMKNIHINRGGNPKLGTASDAGTIWLSGINNITLEDIEIYGDGLGIAMVIGGSSNVTITRPYIHDMHWESDTPVPREVMGAIASIQNTSVLIDSPRIENLLGRDPSSPSWSAYQADAIDSAGGNGFTVKNATLKNVWEGIDISGDNTTSNFLIDSSTVTDCTGWGFKAVHKQGPGTISNSTATRCGISGFVIGDDTSNVTLSNNRSIDSGNPPYSGAYLTAGFSFLNITDAPPKHFILTNNQAIDTRSPALMKYGYRFEGNAALHSIEFTNNTASGYTVAATTGFAALTGSCTFNGSTVANGASVTAYQQGSLPPGYSCAALSETRTCTNGVLSGSYLQPMCTISTSGARDAFSRVADAFTALIADLSKHILTRSVSTVGAGLGSQQTDWAVSAPSA